MSIPRTYGLTFVEEPRTISYSTTAGWETKRQWSTAERGDIVNLMLTLKDHGYTFEVTEGPTYKVTATTPGVVLGNSFDLDPEFASDIPAPAWELLNGTLDKDILSSTHIPIVKALSDETVKKLRDITKGSDENNTQLTFRNGTTTAERRAAFNLRYLISAGITSVPTNIPILRKTQTITDKYTLDTQIVTGLAGSGKIYATQELIAQELVPTFLHNALPKETGFIAEPGLDMGLYYGWLKQHPNIQMVAANRFQVSQEYHFGLWVNWLHGTYEGEFPTLVYS